MPILKATKQALTEYVRNQGFDFLDNSATAANAQWVLACPEGHESSHTITTIRQHMHAGTNIVCPTCKRDHKIQKFLEASDVTLSDGNLLSCNHCELSYRYLGCYYNAFSCYCKHKTRKREHALYRALHEVFPGCLAKEIPYAGGHKCDIVIYIEDVTLFIEVDEIAHKYSTKKKAQDAEYERVFEETRGPLDFLYRIDDRLIADDVNDSVEGIYEHLRSLLEPVPAETP